MPRLLIIEDDSEINHLLRGLFLTEGYEVECVTSVDAANAALDRDGFHVVLLDWLLNEETGEALLPRLAAMVPAPAVVLTSTSPRASAIAKKWSIAFVPKPSQIEVLLGVIKGAVDRSSVALLRQP